VKLIRPDRRPYAEVQAEWAREVQRLLSLRHPNVVYIFDAFEDGALFYLALERCDHALSAMLGTPLHEGLVIELARQLLAAIQFLHDNDVVHDDLHAGNVLIAHGRDRPIVKITDFGISNELRGLPAIRPNVVHHAIMAPEVIATGYTSKQSDIYQAGLLLYWMITGESAVPQGVPYEELLRCVADGTPRSRAESIGTALGNLVAKMLRRREQFRFSLRARCGPRCGGSRRGSVATCFQRDEPRYYGVREGGGTTGACAPHTASAGGLLRERVGADRGHRSGNAVRVRKRSDPVAIRLQPRRAARDAGA
jgi:serine/threonine-protein kinase